MSEITAPKTCIVVKYRDNQYGWNGSNQCNCIMAIKHNKQVGNRDLVGMRNTNEISAQEYNAIKILDVDKGDEEDLKVIRLLGKRIGIEIVIQEVPICAP